ncbi:MATE family efflux transporter [Vibrio kyushuensis]|uniref:MATE family efflux transporter n=1 Tax=Vibrio kyushuensis TaxID=2910249 RepID=UPI003D0E0FB8
MNNYTLKSTLSCVLPIAIPVAFQTLIVASRQLVDVTMLAQVSPIDVAASGLGARILAIAGITSMGLATAVGILSAQYFGQENKQKLSLLTNHALILSLFLGVILVYILSYSGVFISFSSSDILIIELGSLYLGVSSYSCVPIAIILCLSSILRSIHITKEVLLISLSGFIINVIFNCIFIFGLDYIPAMGIKGAAISTVLSSYIEMFILFIYTKHKCPWILTRTVPILKSIKISELHKIAHFSVPIIINSLAFSVGVFLYHAMVAKSSTDNLVVFSVIATFEMVISFLITGFAMGLAVLIGNAIGKQDHSTVHKLSHDSSIIAIGAFMGSLIILLIIYGQYLLSSFSTLHLIELKSLSPILFGFIIFKSITITLICGILRPIGDVRYCLYQDIICLYLIGLPLCYISLFTLNMGLHGVVISMLIEEAVKILSSKYRPRNKQSIKAIAIN